MLAAACGTVCSNAPSSEVNCCQQQWKTALEKNYVLLDTAKEKLLKEIAVALAFLKNAVTWQ